MKTVPNLSDKSKTRRDTIRSIVLQKTGDENEADRLANLSVKPSIKEAIRRRLYEK